MRHIEKLGTLTIEIGETSSNIISSRLGFGAAVDVIIYCPATLPETVTLKVGLQDSALAADMRTLSINTLDVTMAAGKAIVVPTSNFGAMQLVSSGSVASTRAFDVAVQVDI